MINDLLIKKSKVKVTQINFFRGKPNFFQFNFVKDLLSVGLAEIENDKDI